MLAPIPPRRAARCARRRAPDRGGHLPHENQGTQSRDQELHRRSSGRRRSPDLALRRLRRGHVDRGRLLPRSRACCRGCLRSAVRTKGTPGIRGSAQATHCKGKSADILHRQDLPSHADVPAPGARFHIRPHIISAKSDWGRHTGSFPEATSGNRGCTRDLSCETRAGQTSVRSIHPLMILKPALFLRMSGTMIVAALVVILQILATGREREVVSANPPRRNVDARRIGLQEGLRVSRTVQFQHPVGISERTGNFPITDRFAQIRCVLSVCELEETAHHVCLLLDGLQRALPEAASRVRPPWRGHPHSPLG
jgi:hypothetical protein